MRGVMSLQCLPEACYKQLYVDKFDNLDKQKKFLKKGESLKAQSERGKYLKHMHMYV